MRGELREEAAEVVARRRWAWDRMPRRWVEEVKACFRLRRPWTGLWKVGWNDGRDMEARSHHAWLNAFAMAAVLVGVYDSTGVGVIVL